MISALRFALRNAEVSVGGRADGRTTGTARTLSILSLKRLSRDIMGGECKQKRARRSGGRSSGGNQLRNCWSQAVLTGPRAIYQINRGGSDSRRVMGPSAASICQEGHQVSASAGRKRGGGQQRVSRMRLGGHTHVGHVISKPAVDRTIPEYCCCTGRTVPSVAAAPGKMQTSAQRRQRRLRRRPRLVAKSPAPFLATSISSSAQFPRGCYVSEMRTEM